MAILTSLPTEMVEEVLSHLPLHDQATFARVSRFTFRNTVDYIYRTNRRLDDSSAIRRAVKLESVEGIRKALQQKLNVNAVDDTGQTALHHAIRCRRRLNDVIEALLEGGADPTLKEGVLNMTVFDSACFEEYYGAALILLDKQASGKINLRLNHRALNRALHHAVQPLGRDLSPDVYCHYSANLAQYRANQRELVRRLLAMPGARVNGRMHPIYANDPLYGLQGHVGPTLLHASFGIERDFGTEGNYYGIRRPDIEIVRMLLAAGARPNATTGRARTPLDLVTDVAAYEWPPTEDPAFGPLSERDLEDLVNLLVSYGARLDAFGPGMPRYRYQSMMTIQYAATKACMLQIFQFPEAYARCLAVIRAMLKLKGPQRRTAQNPRPATWGILPMRTLNWTVKDLLDTHLEGDPRHSPELMRLFQSHGGQHPAFDLLDYKEEDLEEEDEPPRKRARTGNAAAPAPAPHDS
ncbi:Ankyrin repeat-containing domain protein [Naviculisporaceae sp. PSN 640]